jgi:hypothetical protein
MKTCKLCLFLALVGICRVDAAIGIERENLRFYLSFENGLQPSIAGEGTQLNFAKGTAADAQLVEGRRGNGLKVTPNLSLQYLSPKSFAKDEGTIAFWMKPVGWSGVWQHRYFLLVRSDEVTLHFHMYYGNPWFYVAGDNRQVLVGGNWQAAFEKEPFPENAWTFLAATFKPGKQTFYLNTSLVGESRDGLIEPKFLKKGNIEIPSGDQVIDEVMIFDRSLSMQEIVALYHANAPQSRQK